MIDFSYIILLSSDAVLCSIFSVWALQQAVGLSASSPRSCGLYSSIPNAVLSPTTPLRYVRLPLFFGDYCMVTSGQRQRTSVPRHGQRLRFRPCTPLIAYPYHTRPASWGTTAALMCSVCWQGVDYTR